jgi:hypothetical protein
VRKTRLTRRRRARRKTNLPMLRLPLCRTKSMLSKAKAKVIREAKVAKETKARTRKGGTHRLILKTFVTLSLKKESVTRARIAHTAMILRLLLCFANTRVYLASMPSTLAKVEKEAAKVDLRAEGERALEAEMAVIILEEEKPRGRRARAAEKVSRDQDPLLPEVALGGPRPPRARSIFYAETSKKVIDVQRASAALTLTTRGISMTMESTDQMLPEWTKVGPTPATNLAGR